MSKFKGIVRQVVVSNATLFKNTFIDYRYLICSSAFKERPYYILGADEDNYKHLTGVSSLLSPEVFFEKCINNSLDEDDFDFNRSEMTVGEARNYVKLKIAILPLLNSIFSSTTVVEERFSKGRVICSLATATSDLTLGFTNNNIARPKTLLKGKYINSNDTLELVLRKPTDAKKFSEIIVGSENELMKYYDTIKELVDFGEN